LQRDFLKQVSSLLQKHCNPSNEKVSVACKIKADSATPQQLLAVIEKESLSAYKAELPRRMPEPSGARKFSDIGLTAHEKSRLHQILGNPYTPEHEWLRASYMLDRYLEKPKGLRTASRILVFATALALGYILGGLVYGFTIHVGSIAMVASNQVMIAPKQKPDWPAARSYPAAEIDFSPYMAQLQRHIKRCWFPPRSYENRRVVVAFKILKNGGMSNLHLLESSGYAAADKAALLAVENAAPFNVSPLGSSENVDILFTFNYNAFKTNSMPFRESQSALHGISAR
jgi:TonB family protein